MPEMMSQKPKEKIIEKPPTKEDFERLNSIYDEAEKVFEAEGRESAKLLLPKAYDDLIEANKRDKKKDSYLIHFVWNPESNLTQEEFDSLNLRRKKLSNAIGIMTASGEIRHNLNKI